MRGLSGVAAALRRGWRGWIAALLIAIAAGVLHRQAAADPWADDRVLVAEPSWVQMAAPRMHAALADSYSIAGALTRRFDPLSRASTTGDIRALAACFAALAAGLLFVVLDRLRIPWPIAVPLAFVGVGLVLPASTATSITLALHGLLGAGLLLVLLPRVARRPLSPASPAISPPPDLASASVSAPAPGPAPSPGPGPLVTDWRRLALLGALTCVGALNHPSFLAAAAIVWIGACALARIGDEDPGAARTQAPAQAEAPSPSPSPLAAAAVDAPAATIPRFSAAASSAASAAASLATPPPAAFRRATPLLELAMVGGVGLLALVAGLGAAAWLAYLNAAATTDEGITLAGGVPTIAAIARAIVTGRFDAGLQPSDPIGLRAALAYVLPGPAMLSLPLAAAAFLRRDARPVAWTLAGVCAAVWIFVGGTWLPDPSIAAVPARVAMTALAGVGLTWMAAQPVRGVQWLAIVAAIVLGTTGFVDPARRSVPLQTARLQAFVESTSLVLREPSAGAAAATEGASNSSRNGNSNSGSGSGSGSEDSRGDNGAVRWVAERLAIDRALLLAEPGLWAATRLPAQPGLLRALSEDRALLLFPEARARFERADGWVRSVDLPYPTVGRFLASQPDESWIAIAAHDDGVSSDSFCRDLITALTDDSRGPGTGTSGTSAVPGVPGVPGIADIASLTGIGGLAALGRIDGVAGSRGLLQRGRLDMDYGEALGAGGSLLPAHFTIDTAPDARIAVNGVVNAQTRRGTALVLFDPSRMRTEEWLLGLSADRTRPTIRDTRLQASYLLEEGGAQPAIPFQRQRQPRPRLPVLPSVRLRVPLDATDADWFGAGWHGPEGQGDGAFRWTNADAAEVRVLVSHRRSMRVRIRGSLAAAPGTPNGLGLSWNGAPVEAPSPWSGEREWTVPAALVRRGLNIVTIRVARVVTPAAFAPGGDPRPLGAAIDELSFEPANARQP